MVFEFADLKDARFDNVDLATAKVAGADLTGASITGASLSGADLTSARLVDFTGANNPTLAMAKTLIARCGNRH